MVEIDTYFVDYIKYLDDYLGERNCGFDVLFLNNHNSLSLSQNVQWQCPAARW